MKRREFLKSSFAAAGGGMMLSQLARAADEAAPVVRQFYELRLYHLRRGPKTQLFDRFYRDAAIPALNRAGIANVGVFTVSVGPDNPTMYVLLAHPSLHSLAATHLRLSEDTEFQKAGAEYMNAPATDPAYVRVESTLMVAFEGMPKLEAPSFEGGGNSRLFELRTYESHSLKANEKKIEMFNRGEITLFRHAGFRPVFFGQTMVGTRLPNLTYMLASENPGARDKGWSAFMADPEWEKLRSMPGYSDSEIVCNITNVLLRPTAYSQI
jgi:hypothetical protein